MTVKIEIDGLSAEEVRAQMRALIGDEETLMAASAETQRQMSFFQPTPHRDVAAVENVAATPDAPAADPTPEPKKRGRPRKEQPAAAAEPEPEPSIRANPENREPPADEQDPPEVQAQDAADEAAELEPVPANDVTRMFDEDAGPSVEAEPEVTVDNVRITLGDWLTRAGHLKGEKHPLEAYKVVFAKVTDGVYTTLKDLVEKNAPPAVLAELVEAIKKQDVK